MENMTGWPGNLSKHEEMYVSAVAGILYAPNTIIAMESAFNRKSKFFIREYRAAMRGESQYKDIFIPWYLAPETWIKIPQKEKEKFLSQLIKHGCSTKRFMKSKVPANILWEFWEQGLPLESIYWYYRKSFSFHTYRVFSRFYPPFPI